MKKLIVVLFVAFAAFSCKKNKCAQCHYDGANGQEVEIGEKCGDDIEKAEKDGMVVNGVTYEVHCGEH